MSENKRISDKKLMFLLAAFAVLVRIIYIVDSMDDPTFSSPLVDSNTYHKLAMAWSQRGEFGQNFLWQAIYYPSFLSAVYQISGVSILAAKVVQALLGGITCLLTFKLGKRIFDSTTAAVSALIVATYGPLFFFETQLLATGWSTLWMVLLCVLAVNTLDRHSDPENKLSQNPALDGLVTGLVGSLAVFTRPTFAPLLAGLVCLLFWQLWRRNNSPRLACTYSAGLIVALLIVMVPIASVLSGKTGHTGVLPPSGAINMYIGNNANFEETIKIRPGLDWEDLLVQPQQQGYAADPWSGQPYFTDKVVYFIKNQPSTFIKGLGLKTLHLMSSRELPRTMDIYIHRQWSPLLKAAVFKIGPWGFPLGLLLPLAAVGCWYARGRISGPLVLSIVLYGLSLILVFVASRYRIPLVPLLAVFAAFGLTKVVKLVRANSWPKLVPAALIFACVIGISTMPGTFAMEEMDLRAEINFTVGVKHFHQQQWPQAIEQLELAVLLDPQLSAAHNFLATSLAQSGQYERALKHFRIAVEQRPNNREAINNMAVCQQKKAIHHLQTGRKHEATDAVAACQEYEQALAAHPNWPEALAAWSWVLSTSGDATISNPDLSLDLITTALEFHGKIDPYLLYVKAAALAAGDNYDQAIIEAEKALSLTPSTGAEPMEQEIQRGLVFLRANKPIRNLKDN